MLFHLSLNGHWGHFHLLAILNNLVIHNLLKVESYSPLFGFYLGVEFLGSVVILGSAILGTTTLLCISCSPECEGSHFCTVLSTLLIFPILWICAVSWWFYSRSQEHNAVLAGCSCVHLKTSLSVFKFDSLSCHWVIRILYIFSILPLYWTDNGCLVLALGIKPRSLPMTAKLSIPQLSLQHWYMVSDIFSLFGLFFTFLRFILFFIFIYEYVCAYASLYVCIVCGVSMSFCV